MDATTAQLVVTLLGAGGGGAALLALINGLIKWLSGASHRERVRNTDLVTQRTVAIEERIKAEAERDAADDKRREADEKRWEAEEHISILKRQVIELGAVPLERTAHNRVSQE